MMFRIPQTLLFVMAALAGIGLASSNAQASAQLREKLAELGNYVLKVTPQQPVKIGEFARGPGVDAANASIGIEEGLRGALEKASAGSVRKEAKYTGQGRYSLVNKTAAGETPTKVIKLTAEIRDENDESLLQLP